ncbi:MAG: 4Fe-4S dicluster domain-containing protein [Proteobacteria bacterium]|nr:4Fe-4S dicluster domain-containing protein [Pseudomonadota bacterium]MBU1386873.1 4Fe-4S dicluster domain-containing protein [Pseudomonadota bacterium]MBU1541440.1 4Fe-4S dicluster domain-containing protein [Pseudomonadota bacterium]MBU2480172.1 4Fe-4S dicluster domain-containing protein [Pseudomonadota bacterium]
MNTITKNIQELAVSLLRDKTVDIVIGFKSGTVPMSSVPFVAKTTEQARTFIWDTHCRLNLANYLTGRKEKIGIIAKGCDSRNIANHIIENKISREQLHIIGVPCSGMVDKVKIASEFTEEIIEYTEQPDSFVVKTASQTKTLLKKDYLRANCSTCMHPNPVIYDQLAADRVTEPLIENQFADVNRIEALSRDEKWQHFDDLLQDCIRCYACRNACPLCYCPTCFVDESDPQWVGKGTDTTDIRTFHFLRAYHCAGRCTDCGACVEACPMDINVRDFTRKLNKDVFDMYGWEAGLDIKNRPPLDTFNPDDPDEFIK